MNVMKQISIYAIPAIFFIILCFALYKDVKVFDTFIQGAKEGLSTVIRIIPSLVGLLAAISVFRESGALDLLIYASGPLASVFNIPKEVLPLAFLRPISGSASLAIVTDTIKTYGPDSFIGRTVSTMIGSTETSFYTVTLYFGSVGIKNIRYTLLAALLADTVSVIASVWVCRIIFGG